MKVHACDLQTELIQQSVHITSRLSFLLILVFLALTERVVLLEDLPAVLPRVAVLLSASDVRGESPGHWVLLWKWGLWEEGKEQKAFAMTRNACKPSKFGEDHIGDYCKTANNDLALENCHCWEEPLKCRTAVLPSPSCLLLAGWKERKHAEQTGAKPLVIKALVKLIGTCSFFIPICFRISW